MYVVNDGTVLDKGNNVNIGHGTVIGAFPLMFEKGTHRIIFGTKKVRIEPDVVIGNNVTIMGGFYGETVIKKGARIWDGTIIGHDCVIGEDAVLSTGVILNGEVIVGDWSFIGSGVIVKPQVTIGKFVLVGIGAVVLGDIHDYGVVVGGEDPPKVIRVNEWRPQDV